MAPAEKRWIEGWRQAVRAAMMEALRLSSTLRRVNLDPNTHAFVAATAALTSVAFTVSTLNVLAVVLSHLLR